MKTTRYTPVVSRKLREMFPEAGERKRVRGELLRYGVSKVEPEPDRVRLAVLKVAGPSFQRVHEWVDISKRDYRDVVSAAEYPNQLRAATMRMSKDDRKVLARQDLLLYQTWMKKR